MKKPHSTRAARDYAKRIRITNLCGQLRLLSEVLCDSHIMSDKRATLGRMYRALVELLGAQTAKPDVESRKALAAVFAQCRWNEGQTTHIHLDGNLLHISGDFDIKELAKRLVWIDVAENEKVVGDEEEEYNASKDA